MIPIKINNDGPEVDKIKKIVKNDENVKGMWCVPKFSNPGGEIYSDSIIKELSKLKTVSEDFRIFWDNAYSVHDFFEETNITSIFEQIFKENNENLVIGFASTSKITFAGAGISAIACKGDNFKALSEYYSFKTIGFDKINQEKHSEFLMKSEKNKSVIHENIRKHMLRHAKILKPKFDVIIKNFRSSFDKNPIISWSEPNGGYFIKAETFGSAKRTVSLCKELGLTLTKAGVMYPYGLDYKDSTIRIAPSYLSLNEISEAIKIFVLCVKISAIEKIMLSGSNSL